MPDTLSTTLTAIAISYGLPLLLVFWYACRVRHPARSRWRAFLMALAVVAVVPPATMAGIYYWIVIHEGSPLMASPAVLAMLFLLRALILGWLRRPPAVRRAPERSGPSQPVPAEAWDALATLATQQADQSRQSTEAGAGRRPIPARHDGP